jgi:hypothetical protein
MPPIRSRTTGSFSSLTESRGSLGILGRSRIEERTVLKRGNYSFCGASEWQAYQSANGVCKVVRSKDE